jgi:hypothetical protein
MGFMLDPPRSPQGSLPPAPSGGSGKPINDVAVEITTGLLRSLALVIGGGMVMYAVLKLHDNPTLISIGGGMIAFATGGSIRNKVTADAKIQAALYADPPAVAMTAKGA